MRKKVETFLFLGAIASTIPTTIATETARPRGVGPECQYNTI